MGPEIVSSTSESPIYLALPAHLEIVKECLCDLILDIRREIGILDDYDLAELRICHEVSE